MVVLAKQSCKSNRSINQSQSDQQPNGRISLPSAMTAWQNCSRSSCSKQPSQLRKLLMCIEKRTLATDAAALKAKETMGLWPSLLLLCPTRSLNPTLPARGSRWRGRRSVDALGNGRNGRGGLGDGGRERRHGPNQISLEFLHGIKQRHYKIL